MSFTSRPIDAYLEDTEIDINGLFHYNFNDKIGNDFTVSSINYTNESIKGIKFTASPQKEETVVRFGDNDFMFHAFILTKDVDTTTEDYALMIELNDSNFTKRMFVQFPLTISDKDSDVDDLISLIEIVEGDSNAFKPITNEKVTPNKWFPINEGYKFYTFKNENTIFVLFDDQLSITQSNKELLDDTYQTYFSDGTQMGDRASGTVYENTSTSSVKQINISDVAFQDIYIECSPEGDNVIRPQKVFTIRKLFDFGKKKESFVSNIEGFDADTIPEISRQFGIFLVGMVIFVIVYFIVNPELFLVIINKKTNIRFERNKNLYRYTIYALTVFIAFCSLFFLLRNKPEIVDYKTRFGALEIKKLPLVWFITILFGVLAIVVLSGEKRVGETVINTVSEKFKNIPIGEGFDENKMRDFIKIFFYLFCCGILAVIIWLIILYSELDIWIKIFIMCLYII